MGVTLVALVLSSACSACGKDRSGGVDPAVADAAFVSRTVVPPDASVVKARDVAMWSAARDAGGTEELAALAVHEGAMGLVEAAADETLRPIAIRAMAYAPGWAHLPYLVKTAGGDADEEARLSLETIVDLAARPRHSRDEEDVDDLRAGCGELLALAKDGKRPKERRIPALRALRMMPCPKADLPTDLDAK
ncbi:MAG: hypothetical protein JST00_46585 [Deltaproteobacteria bacterium]|nr:hypothetical protein [Deltaproteobacteria bacterium]